MSFKQRLNTIEKKLNRDGKEEWIPYPAEDFPEYPEGKYDKQNDGTWVLLYTYKSTGEVLTEAEYKERFAKVYAKVKNKYPGKTWIMPFMMICDDRPISISDDE